MPSRADLQRLTAPVTLPSKPIGFVNDPTRLVAARPDVLAPAPPAVLATVPVAPVTVLPTVEITPPAVEERLPVAPIRLLPPPPEPDSALVAVVSRPPVVGPTTGRLAVVPVTPPVTAASDEATGRFGVDSDPTFSAATWPFDSTPICTGELLGAVLLRTFAFSRAVVSGLPTVELRTVTFAREEARGSTVPATVPIVEPTTGRPERPLCDRLVPTPLTVFPTVVTRDPAVPTVVPTRPPLEPAAESCAPTVETVLPTGVRTLPAKLPVTALVVPTRPVVALVPELVVPEPEPPEPPVDAVVVLPEPEPPPLPDEPVVLLATEPGAGALASDPQPDSASVAASAATQNVENKGLLLIFLMPRSLGVARFLLGSWTPRRPIS